MISLSHFRKNLFSCFNLMKDGAEFTIYHRRKVYKLKVEPTGEKVQRPYRITRQRKVAPSMVKTKNCPECADLLVNGICMNKGCANAKSPLSEALS